jgi:hypothetical protein
VFATEAVTDRIGQASSLVGLLLVLVTVFTSEQARALEAERQREGGATPGARRRIMAISLSLVAVTVAALLALVPLLLDVVRAWMAGHRNPLHIVFALVWLLLAPLSGWQLSIALAARRIGSK